MTDATEQNNPLELAAELTMAWLSNPNTRVAAEDVPSFLKSMHQAVQDLATGSVEEQPEAAREFTPAVTARRSLSSKDHIVSMIDGKPYKTLKRHLSRHGLTPQQYRQRYNLKPDYPMVSESYSQTRRDMAKRIGLGRKPKGAAAAADAKPTAGRGRKKAAEAPATAE